MAKIFISYRRDDSIETVGRIVEFLRIRLPPDSIFFDLQTIPPGSNFRESIKHAILDEAEVVLVIIGKSWAVSKGEDGQPHRRLFEEDDPVRMEIELAFLAARQQQARLVIPVLVQNATMPTKAELPDSIATLVYLNAVHVRPDPDFDNDIRALRDTLVEQVKSIPFAAPYTYGISSAMTPLAPPPRKGVLVRLKGLRRGR